MCSLFQIYLVIKIINFVPASKKYRFMRKLLMTPGGRREPKKKLFSTYFVSFDQSFQKTRYKI